MKPRYLFLLLLSLPLLILAQSAPAAITPADRVIAVVNNEAIAEYDLKQHLAVAMQQ